MSRVSSQSQTAQDKEIFVDARVLLHEPHSGVARFVSGLLGALDRGLTGGTHRLVVVHDGYGDAEALDFDGSVALQRSVFPSFYKPRVLWSSCVWRRLGLEKRESAFWLSPNNIDSPVGFGSCGGRMIQFIHDFIPLRSADVLSPLRIQMAVLTRLLVRRGGRFVVTSEELKEELEKEFGVEGDRVLVCPPRLSPLFSRPAAAISGELSSYVELLRGKFVILCVGRDEAYKQWGLARDLLREAQIRDFDPVLVYVGRSEVCPSFLDEEPPPQFCGPSGRFFSAASTLWVNGADDAELCALYQRANLVFHPSLFEGFGFPIAEAYISGVPVLFRDHVGASRTLSRFDDQEGVFRFSQFSDAVVSEALAFTSSEAAGGQSDEVKARRRVRRLGSPLVAKLLLEWKQVAEDLLRFI